METRPIQIIKPKAFQEHIIMKAGLLTFCVTLTWGFSGFKISTNSSLTMILSDFFLSQLKIE